jgi:hypothetical protein
MTRLDIERQRKLEPTRTASTKAKLEKLGYQVKQFGRTRLEFDFKGAIIRFFPYSGWFTGKTVTDGRGFDNLLKQLQNNRP